MLESLWSIPKYICLTLLESRTIEMNIHFKKWLFQIVKEIRNCSSLVYNLINKSEHQFPWTESKKETVTRCCQGKKQQVYEKRGLWLVMPWSTELSHFCMSCQSFMVKYFLSVILAELWKRYIVSYLECFWKSPSIFPNLLNNLNRKICWVTYPLHDIR